MEHTKVVEEDQCKEIAALRARLEEAEQALDAIRHGEVDAIVVYEEQEEQIYVLQGADHFYRVLVETMNEGTATLSQDGLVLYANARLATLLKTNLEELLGKNFLYFVKPEDRKTFDTFLERSSRNPARGEIALQCLNGAQVPVLLSLSSFSTQDVASFCLVATDLTEQKQTEAYLQERTEELCSANEELEVAREEMNAQNEELLIALESEKSMRQQLIQTEKYAALARLVASVAHEINNPLQTVQNSLYLIKDIIPEENGHEFMEMALSESNRIASLVQQLRETYRPSNLQTVEFNLVDNLTKVANLLAPQLKQNNIEWQMHICADCILIHGVPDQLQQVFLNICLNAIDAIGSKGGQMWVDVSLPEDQQKVCISIQDTGPGIPIENQARIFEPFFTTKAKGTGLGLAISYEIVKDHAGEITVESSPGKGAMFVVWLPLKK